MCFSVLVRHCAISVVIKSNVCYESEDSVYRPWLRLNVTERRAVKRHRNMPGYKSKPKKGKKSCKRHHRSSSSPPRRKATPTLAQLMQDPICASLLHQAREHHDPEAAERVRQEAVRLWREYNPSTSREPSPLWVSSFALCGAERTPESEFGEGDSSGEEEEQEDEEEAYPPSLYDASTVDYGEEEEEEESKEEDYLPPPVGPSTIMEEGEEQECDEEEYPPSECSAYPDDDGGEEEENVDYPPSEGSYTEEEESPPPSELSARTVKRRWSQEAGSSPERSPASDMDCSRGGSSGHPMSWSRGSEEEMEAEEAPPTARSGGRSPGEEGFPYGPPRGGTNRAAPGASANRAGPGASASCAASGGGFAARAGGAPPTTAPAAPVAPGLSPLIALLLARSLAPLSCVSVPVFVCLPVCVPNPFSPLVPLCVSVPVCMFVNVPFNVSNVFSPVFPGGVC
ncbi:uncharacterized protein LOC143518467 [Brachyhypopomus gauderio]|uniref:uncharacterized protein LOC143518467 n=1 Tax=Brachyhypopomus gauderio TaxID=698409 RepID=UPI004042DE1C